MTFGSDRSTWKIKAAGYADDKIVIERWDEILRLIATIKLKEGHSLGSISSAQC